MRRGSAPSAAPCKRPIAFLALACALLAGGVARAGAISVMPTRVDFTAERGVQSLLLTNLSGETVTVEAQATVWPDDAEGQQANDVVVTPAVITLPPNQRMRVRIGLLRRPSDEVERGYRVYFTELPGASTSQNLGLAVRLRVGVPVFVAPRARRPAPLVWTGREEAGAWRLQATNPGNVHVKLIEAALRGGRGADRPLTLASRYVLPKQGLDIALTEPPSAGAKVRWIEGAGDEHESAVVLP